MSTFFIADLHLNPDQPAMGQLFLNFLRQQTQQTEALYLLGDLFEMWIGDDYVTPFHQSIITGLSQARAKGIKLYFMPGNRDFLIGKQFIQETGCCYLPDPTLIELYGTPTLLTHGDRFCTLDKPYLRYRRWSRYAFCQSLFLHLPRSWRQKIAFYLRHHPERAGHSFDPQYDIVFSDLCAYLNQYPTTLQIIHGHTHRPGIHLFKQANITWMKRFTLGDWSPTMGHVLIASPHDLIKLLYFNTSTSFF
ncbi:UDP-2,3-diacylglucosamine diphosphatase [Rickettsiella grylli]|uniref:UDP-2,3-diacylglucosamine diphosphatase n=1 Tax=Rickettsiella grylli TaxID=59196 RepID=UPI0008FCE5E0|nr:UDP-2,3-diacylglucosamine diphosphatase [Rickettsiella grylli]OJA00040.1 UDP-2,3-diacylglucosamine diphosphatase [Rickettsiella grylli]